MNSFQLDTTLFNIGENQVPWAIKDAVEGVQIFGGIGSGKTSGSGRYLALKYLKHGFGGLVLTVKPDEKELWENYCAIAGRTTDLIIVEPHGKEAFDFLAYECQTSINKEAITENIVQVLKTVIRASEDKSGGKSDDPFWESALDMLLFNLIDLCLLAYGRITIDLMYSIVQTIPKKNKDGLEAVLAKRNEKDGTASSNHFMNAFYAATKNVNVLIDEWKSTLSLEMLDSMDSVEKDRMMTYEGVPESRTLDLVYMFFFETYISLSEKTRSIIDFSFSAFLMRLLKNPVYSLFCKKQSTFTPEDSLYGKIIVLNLPTKLYQKVGRDIQIMFKYIWQRAMEKRNIKENDRPVFLWADEAQNFIHEHDADYQATARSSKIATVYLTQNLPNYYANMGGEKADYRVKSFLGTLGTKIFHANADIETNKYASELIGEGYSEDLSRTATVAGSFSSSKSVSLQLERIVRAEELVSLKNGGAINSFLVEGYLHKQGNPISGLFNFKKMLFNQNYQ